MWELGKPIEIGRDNDFSGATINDLYTPHKKRITIWANSSTSYSDAESLAKEIVVFLNDRKVLKNIITDIKTILDKIGE